MRLIDAEKYKEDFLDSNNEFNTIKTLNMQPTVKAIVIPDGATNGDMIKKLFPYADIKIFSNKRKIYGVKFRHDSLELTFNEEWWNSKYITPHSL